MEYYEETELRLGLPGHDNSINNIVNGGSSEKMAMRKRGFSKTQEGYLKLNLGSKGLSDSTAEIDRFVKAKRSSSTSNLLTVSDTESAKPLPTAQVVGWPPLRSFRKNTISAQKTKNSSEEEKEKQEVHTAGAQGGGMVKVCMDGAPYLRKVDLKMYNSYHQLSYALAHMFFNSFSIGHHESQEIMNESKLKDLQSGNEYVFTYEDKDGDWMLVGDVPWKIFVESCKKLRLMKATDHAHRLEKCKERGSWKSEAEIPN